VGAAGRFLFLVLVTISLTAARPASAACSLAPSTRASEPCEDSVTREELAQQRLEHRERVRQLRLELRREMINTPLPPPPQQQLPIMLEPERRRMRAAGEDGLQERPEHDGGRLQRLSPEERMRLRHDVRDVWRESMRPPR